MSDKPTANPAAHTLINCTCGLAPRGRTIKGVKSSTRHSDRCPVRVWYKENIEMRYAA